MIRFESEFMTALQAEDEPIDNLPLNDRSDKWWCKFWHIMGEREAKRVKEKCNERL